MMAIISPHEIINKSKSKEMKYIKRETEVEIEKGKRKESNDISSNNGGKASKINGKSHCIWKSIEILFNKKEEVLSFLLKVI